MGKNVEEKPLNNTLILQHFNSALSRWEMNEEGSLEQYGPWSRLISLVFFELHLIYIF